jgi:hypothetical protein
MPARIRADGGGAGGFNAVRKLLTTTSAGYVSKRAPWASLLVGLASTFNWEIYSSYA